MEEDQQQTQAPVDIYGRPLLAWEVDEYPRHERSRSWYILASVVGVALIIYSVATANFLFAVIILMLGIITLVSTFRDPERIEIVVTTTGVIVGNTFYEYKTVKDFSLVYRPPETKILYMALDSLLHPILSVPLENTDPNAVRECLLPYCLENLSRTEEGLTDTFRRLYKL